jgi:hypothetical protein
MRGDDIACGGRSGRCAVLELPASAPGVTIARAVVGDEALDVPD